MGHLFVLLATATVALGAGVDVDAAVGHSTDAGLQLQEIVVTAEKRSENVQEVPAAITVVSSEALTKAGLSEFSDLTKLASSLTIIQDAGPASNTIAMRGVGTFAFSIGVESSVLVVVDDVAQSLQAEAFSDLVDLDHVEVLRGPQSTLFGKSASAGVINVTTKAPTDHFTALGQIMATNDGEQRYAGSISGPFSETVRYRLSVADRLYAGNVTDLQSGRTINGSHELHVRGQIAWDPTSDFSVKVLGHWTRNNSDCCIPTYFILGSDNIYSALDGTNYSPQAVFPGVTPGPNNLNARTSFPPENNTTDRGGSLHLAYNVGDQTLTSITSLNHYTLADKSDFDGTPIDELFQYGTFDSRAVSEEVRLSSSAKPVGYVLGAYYAKDDNVRRFHRTPPIATANWRGEQISKTAALFGQSTWFFVDKTALITGLRFNNEKIAYSFDDYRRSKFYPQAGFPGSASESVVTGKFGFQHEFTRDLMAFLTYSRGYKGQAYDLTSSFRPSIEARQPVKAEHSNSYELGVKSEWLDRRIMLNATLFRTDYRNLQAQSIEPGVGGSFVLSNVGTVLTRGVEVEWSARVNRQLQFGGGLAYVDAKIGSFPDATCYTGQTAAQGCVPSTVDPTATVQNLAGATLSNAPKWKGNLAAEYDVPTGGLPVDGAINLNYSFQSATNLDLGQDPGARQRAFGIANLSFALTDATNKRFSVTLFVNNIFDKHYFSNVNNEAAWNNPAYSFFAPRDFRRYAGIRATVSY